VGGLTLDLVAAAAGPVAGARAAFLVAVALFGISAILLRPVVEPRRGRPGRVATTTT
jgi:hypothetical protein